LNPRPPRCQRGQIVDAELNAFEDFMKINMRLEPSTAQNTLQDIRRFLKASNRVVSYEEIEKYLRSYLGKAGKTYNSQITSLRRFVRDFLRLPNLIMSFKMCPVDDFQNYENLPSRKQIEQGFRGLKDNLSNAVYLFVATTGLRKGEVLGLLKSQIDRRTHATIPRHFTRKKRSGITFYNRETSRCVEEYLTHRKDKSEKLFPISDRRWRKIWRNATKSAGVRITSKILRAWFSTEMGELGCPDRFVDIFQGRAPRSVLAKHYTGKGLERLRRIYFKAELKVLS
jgi:integrase